MNPEPAGVKQLEEILVRLINLSVGLGFVAATIFLVWGGIKYLTSGGEPKSIQQANSTITWALLGILFLGLAWLILQLIEKVTGVSVTNLTLCSLFPGGGCP